MTCSVFARLVAVGLLVSCSTQPPTVVTPAADALSLAVHSRQVLPLSTGDPGRGRAAFIDLQCHACHRVAEDDALPIVEDAWEGPLLSELGKESPEAVGWKIVTRTRLGPESIFESPMVESASAMTERELVDVIAYLRDPIAGRDEKQ